MYATTCLATCMIICYIAPNTRWKSTKTFWKCKTLNFAASLRPACVWNHYHSDTCSHTKTNRRWTRFLARDYSFNLGWENSWPWCLLEGMINNYTPVTNLNELILSYNTQHTNDRKMHHVTESALTTQSCSSGSEWEQSKCVPSLPLKAPTNTEGNGLTKSGILPASSHNLMPEMKETTARMSTQPCQSMNDPRIYIENVHYACLVIIKSGL